MHANALIHELSPYLLQHAHNPVNWLPWGQTAFEKARRENKPIFLSIGYSTCHWCHVMERESFENKEIASILNRHFVPVKVDREERPDVDRVYMTYVQAATGGGGWPMSLWLTPDLKPFLGGTYFPPEDRGGRPGFETVLLRVAEAWEKEQAAITESSNAVMSRLRIASGNTAPGTDAPDRALLKRGYEQFKASYDPEEGGFGDAPKFPRTSVPDFLLRFHARTGAADALDMTIHTLRKMAMGGLHDHLGGGFHRYSVDARWHVPHFEKMLYDQAQLACTYLDACQRTRDPFFAHTARDILEYVRRDMTGEQGQFYCAEDADSPRPGNPGENAEGAFYVWTRGEITEALGPETAELFAFAYGVEPDGNVRDDPHGEFQGRNVLILSHPAAEIAAHFKRPEAGIRERLEAARQLLFETRARRPRPRLDDKTLTAWNGLMISAFARAHQVLGDPAYLRAARRAADFIRANLYDKSRKVLLRHCRAGKAVLDGYA
ncbi:MAG: thioredoxin domain-containing protein, partial [Kiritimatiellia bacterium]|nr:thioredoxin domain-containing protein [Kiritimatiellia bacterium]